jgi:hypothetical protein
MSELEENSQVTLVEKTKNESQNRVSVHAVREIENYYREGIIAYAEGLSRYGLEISKLKANISTEIKLIENDEATLEILERTVGYDEKLLQKYNDDFSQKIHSIQELDREYKDMLDNKEYKKLETRKKHELQEILDETEELEMTLLQHELERLNIFIKLKPKKRLIMELKSELSELHLDKEYFESTKLYQIPRRVKKKESKEELIQKLSEEPVETEVIEQEDVS